MLRHTKQDGGAKDGGAHQYLKRPRSSSQNDCRRWQPVSLIPVAKSTEATAPLAVPESAIAAIAVLASANRPQAPTGESRARGRVRGRSLGFHVVSGMGLLVRRYRQTLRWRDSRRIFW